MKSASKLSGLDLAKSAAKGNTGLAEALRAVGVNITPQAISQWRRVPTNRVLDVEKVTRVPREQLRPDIYPPADVRRRA